MLRDFASFEINIVLEYFLSKEIRPIVDGNHSLLASLFEVYLNFKRDFM